MSERPTSTINSACTIGNQRFDQNDKIAIWQRNGRSWSCPYCGSMSTEELLECIDAVPSLMFNLNDSREKVYIDRYAHAGDCPVYCKCGGGQDRHVGERNYKEAWAKSWRDGPIEHPFRPDNSSASGCTCDVKNGGGPIKFYIVHLNDLADQDEAEVVYRRLMFQCQRSNQEFMARLHKQEETR